MDFNKFVSIIIPVKEINDYIRESIPIINQLHYKEYEIIILPNENNIKFEAPNVRIIPTGKVGPAQKRNLGAKMAKGEILAFLDDDAYPRYDWLNNALKYFNESCIVGVGGPGITPDSDPFWAHVSGAVFLTKVGGGNPDRYIPSKNEYFTDDWPSVNLLIRKDDFLGIGGFNNEFWPGEDTKLCQDLVYSSNKRIIYSPNVVVWHHRRPSILKHLNQVANYGLHRGFFARQKDQNSNKLLYYVPAFFTVFIVIFGLGAFYNVYIKYLFLIGISFYLVALIFAFFDIYAKIQKIFVAFFSLPLIFLTHLFYGVNFIRGFLKSNLKSKLR